MPRIRAIVPTIAVISWRQSIAASVDRQAKNSVAIMYLSLGTGTLTSRPRTAPFSFTMVIG